MLDAHKQVDVVRLRDGRLSAGVDRAATEEPLEVRLHGRPFAVIMRTPGADRELAAGFLFSEGVVKSADDLGTIEYCTDPTPDHGIVTPELKLGPTPDSTPDQGIVTPELQLGPPMLPPHQNVINVTLTGASLEDLDRVLAERRQVIGNSSCGMCGRLTIESLEAKAAPLARDRHVTQGVVASLPDRLRARQTVFDETGGLHAAGLFAADGRLEAAAEDVGRHNAVDKVIGRMLMKDALPLSDLVLCVSGRTSFEIVQKAVLAGIPIVAAVSAPSTLAIELAEQTGLTLLGFVRGGAFNIYAHPERIV
jgi:FdhD protein